MSDLMEREESALAEVFGTQNLATKKWDEIITANTLTFPMDDMLSLGINFTPLTKVFSSVAPKLKGTGTLYEVSFPKGGHLAAAKDGSGFIGAAVKDGKGVVGQARFHEVKESSAPSGPDLFTAVALMAINKSLKNIAETQKGILCFLETDKETQLKGNLLALTDIINDYHHNWNNAQYLSNREIQVLEIKRNAEQNILFYREMIESKLGKQKLIHIDTAKTLNGIEANFKYYQLSLYLFSFSSFMDIMLLKNYDKDYLDSVAQKVRQYALDYDAFYQNAISSVERIAETSVQSRALKGLAVAGKFVGKQISKIPDKDNKITLDDKLVAGGEKLDDKQSKLITDTKEGFKVVQDNGIALFIEKIDLINALYNDRVTLAFDGEKLYLNAGDEG